MRHASSPSNATVAAPLDRLPLDGLVLVNLVVLAVVLLATAPLLAVAAFGALGAHLAHRFADSR